MNTLPIEVVGAGIFKKTFDEIRNNHILKFEKNKTQKSSFLKKHQGRFCSHPS